MKTRTGALPTATSEGHREFGITSDLVLAGESGFYARELSRETDRVLAHRLRYEVFCDELLWVEGSEAATEVDLHDEDAIFFGVFGENGLVAFARLVLPENTFMIEKEFSFLLDKSYRIRKQNDTAEVSRLCVASEARGVVFLSDSGPQRLSMLLYKAIYLWCVSKGIQYLYVVLDYRVWRLFRLIGFPCQFIGKPIEMPDGCVAVAGRIDLSEMFLLNKTRRPDLIKWFTHGQSSQCEVLPQRPEFCSPHPSF